MEDSLVDKVVTIGAGAVIAAIFTGSLVLPVFNKLLGSITAEKYGNIQDISTISDLMWFVLIIVAIGIIIAIVRYAASRER